MFFLGVTAIMIAVGLGCLWYESRRTRAWQELATRPGMQFLGPRNDVLAKYGRFRVFHRGSGRKVYNAVAVQAGDVRLVAGDFRYSTGSGKSRSVHLHTICVLESDQLDLPHCYLRPEHRLLDALGALFGGQDIDFAEDSAFSKAYVLQGDDESAVRAVFDEDVRAWFAERKDRRFHFEAEGRAMIFQLGKRCPPRDVPELMDQALQVLKRLSRSSP